MLGSPVPPEPRLVWAAQPSAQDIIKAEGFHSSSNAQAASASMSCYVLADGRLDVCSPSDGDRRYGEAILSLQAKYRLDLSASPVKGPITVSVTFPKLDDTDAVVIARPSLEEMRVALPKDMTAQLQCRVSIGGDLKDCEVDTSPEHEKDKAAALGLAGKFRLKPAMLNGKPTEAYVSVSLSGSRHLITDPDWVRRPGGDEVASAYPDIAARSGLSGSARMRCSVNEEGKLTNCLILDESPAGVGFGDAVLRLASKFQMRPRMIDGKATTGEVTVPVTFRLAGSGPKIDPHAPGSFRILPWAPWIETPTAADVAAAFPTRALNAKVYGDAAIRCTFKPDGRLVACESSIDGPDPMGFDRAALSLARKFRADLTGLKPFQLADLRIAIRVGFTDRALQSAEQRYMRAPQWLRAPDTQSVVNAYPDKAVKAGVLSGKAIVDCQIGPTGGLEACVAKSQAPDGLDFGASAEKVAPLMQANLWTRDGEPAAGQHIRVPMRFIYSGEPPAATKGAPSTSAPAP